MNGMCKRCGYVIILGGCYADQKAQDHGFCSESCQQQYGELKNTEMEAARRLPYLIVPPINKGERSHVSSQR